MCFGSEKMIKKRKYIITNNRELYEKLNMLSFTPEVILKDVKKRQIAKILKSINKDGIAIKLEEVGDYFLLKKVGHTNFNVYLK